PAPAPAAAATIGARRSKLASRSFQTMSCWIAATRRSATATPDHLGQAREPLDGVVEDLEALAAGEPHEVAAVLLVGVEHLVRDRDDADQLGQRPAERVAVAVRCDR